MCMFAGTHGVVSVFHRRHTCRTYACHAEHFARRHIQQAMHHHAVSGHGLVGIGSGAGQAADGFCCNALDKQAVDCFGSQLGIGVRREAAFGIDGVMARQNAVGTQNHTAHA